MEYNAYNELMNYFQYEYNVYMALFAIVLAGFIKTTVGYISVKQLEQVNHNKMTHSLYDLMISFIAIVGLANALFFQGVMSDIPMVSGHAWLSKSLLLVIASCLLFVVQIALFIHSTIRVGKWRRG